MPKSRLSRLRDGDFRPHFAGIRRAYPSQTNRGTAMDEDEFYAAQLSAWPWLHLSE